AASLLTRSLAGVVAPDVVSLTGGAATFDTRNVGNAKTVAVTGLTLSGADAANYSLTSTTATTAANISPPPLTANVTAASKSYDGTAAAAILTRSLAGVLASDTVTLTGGSASFDTKNVAAGKLVTATGLTLAGADAGNYALSNTTATTTADVTPQLL